MKSALKGELHKIIDAIEDEETLHILREDLATYTTALNIDGLLPEQIRSLDTAIVEADNETDPKEWSEFRKSIEQKWKES